MPPPPPPPRNPLLDDQLRYRQVLGAYQRSYAPLPADSKPQRTAYVRLANRSRRHHDGFYFRFAGGLGYLHDAAKSDIPLPSKTEFDFQKVPLDGSGGGTAGVTELAVGYTLTAGFTLGVSVDTAVAPGPVLDVTDPNTGSYHYKPSQLAVIGVLADWYFFPERGFHAQLSPGVSTYVAGSAESDFGPQAQAHTAVGFGFMLGVGYDFWVGDEWSLGFLGRMTYGAMSGADDRHVSWTHTSYSPAVLLSATYN